MLPLYQPFAPPTLQPFFLFSAVFSTPAEVIHWVDGLLFFMHANHIKICSNIWPSTWPALSCRDQSVTLAGPSARFLFRGSVWPRLQAIPPTANFLKVCETRSGGWWACVWRRGSGGCMYSVCKQMSCIINVLEQRSGWSRPVWSVGWARSPLKSKTMTWLRCSDRNWFVHCEISRAGMENKQILDGLCQDNGIIHIENWRGQFSHNHVFCLTFSLSLSLCLPSPHPLCGTHANTHTLFSLYCSALLLFSTNSRCGNVERNLHRKQPPIRIALFMSRQRAAYKKAEKAWIRRRWAESGLTDSMHSPAFAQDAQKIHRDTRARTSKNSISS